jgi:hypothetical protein
MLRLLILLGILLLPGCSGVTPACFTDEVGSLIREDLNASKDFNVMAGEFIQGEAYGSRGFGRDFVLGSGRESAIPGVYLDDLGSLFRTCY